MKGLYVSYNEQENGSVEELVRISNQDYLIFKHKKPVRQYLTFPTKILIRVSKIGDFYLGDLIKIKNYNECNPKIFEDPKHRPTLWQSNKEEAKSVFFISNLKQISEPLDLKDQHPPQGIIYRDFD